MPTDKTVKGLIGANGDSDAKSLQRNSFHVKLVDAAKAIGYDLKSGEGAQRRLAKAVGVDPSQVSRWLKSRENDGRQPSGEVMCRLLLVLGLGPEYFVDEPLPTDIPQRPAASEAYDLLAARLQGIEERLAVLEDVRLTSKMEGGARVEPRIGEERTS